MTNPPYSDAEITTLRELWDEGHSTREIGRRLHRSKNSVIGRARRLGLPSRPSPVKRDPDTVSVPRHIWTTEETERLCSLRADGHTYAEIGRRIGVSGKSAQDKGFGLDLPSRARNRGMIPPLQTLVSVARMPLQQHQWAALSSRPPQPAPSTNVVQLRLPITPARACQYPLWGALHADDRPVFGRMCDDPRPGSKPRFCGVPAAAGAYCSRHYAITHRKVAEVAA